MPLRVLRDERLAELVTRGDDRAFEEIYRRHHQAIYRYCRSILHQEQDAQDALQTTMVAALRRLRTEARDAPVRPWLFRIAHNESVTLIRRRRPCQPLEHGFAVAGPSLESRLEDRRRLDLLVADLGRLPDRQRAALVMRELSDLSHEEIAYALELPVSSVKQAIFDARKGLQEFEAGRAMNCDVVQRAISDCDGRALRARRLRAHLDGCADCASWRDAIGARREMLGSLVGPPLGPGFAIAILARITRLGHTGGGGVAAAVAKGAAGTAAGKALLGVALVAVTAGGLSEVHRAQANAPAQAAGRPAVAATPAARRPATTTFTAEAPKRATWQPGGHDDRPGPATPAPGDTGAGKPHEASIATLSPAAGSAPVDGRTHGKGPQGSGSPGQLKKNGSSPSTKHGKPTKGTGARGQLKKSGAAPSAQHGKATKGGRAPGQVKKQKAGSTSPASAPPPGNGPSARGAPGQGKKGDSTQPSSTPPAGNGPPTPPPGNGPSAGGPPGQAESGGSNQSSSDQSSSNAQPNDGQHGSSNGQGNKSGK